MKKLLPLGSAQKGATDLLKRKKLRHNEYYDMQYHFDSLYAQSTERRLES